MAEEAADGQEKTEEPTEERRESFRNRGEIAQSREISSVLVLCSSLAFLSFFASSGLKNLKLLLISQFQQVAQVQLSSHNLGSYFYLMWLHFLKLIVPLFLVTTSVAIFSTLAQTRFNVSLERLKPSWSKVSLIAGLKRIFSSQALLELVKGLGKMMAVGLVSYLILYSEWRKLPALLNLSIIPAWSYWAEITRLLFWAVIALLLLIAAGDYFFQFFQLEKRMRMSKQEIKEEYKQREADPLIKGRMRRMQREFANRRTIEASKQATVIITNPTHYAVALKYEFGMRAPTVVAKGVDLLALRMREVAKSCDIPMVENKPLARTLYKVSEVDAEIPESLYKAVSEVIRYVFKLKGIKVGPS